MAVSRNILHTCWGVQNILEFFWYFLIATVFQRQDIIFDCDQVNCARFSIVAYHAVSCEYHFWSSRRLDKKIEDPFVGCEANSQIASPSGKTTS